MLYNTTSGENVVDTLLSFECDNVQLNGILHTPEGQGPFPGVAVCHPHPLYGGDMNNNVVMAICQGLLAKGIAAFRFDFRGSGNSAGKHDSGIGEQRDVIAALETLTSHPHIDVDHTGLAGYSFGASMALLVAPTNPTVQGLAAVAPPLTNLGSPGILAFPQPKLILAGDRDSFANIDQVKAIVTTMTPPTEFSVIQEADHFMVGHEMEIAIEVGQFFSHCLRP